MAPTAGQAPPVLAAVQRGNTCCASVRDVRRNRFFVQLNPPHRDQNFSFTGLSLPTQPHISQKQKKTRKCNSVEKKNRNAQSAYSSCWLNCQLPFFVALRSLEKNRSKIQRHRGSAVPFLRLVAQKKEIRQPGVISQVFSYPSDKHVPLNNSRVTEWCLF